MPTARSTARAAAFACALSATVAIAQADPPSPPPTATRPAPATPGNLTPDEKRCNAGLRRVETGWTNILLVHSNYDCQFASDETSLNLRAERAIRLLSRGELLGALPVVRTHEDSYPDSTASASTTIRARIWMTG